MAQQIKFHILKSISGLEYHLAILGRNGMRCIAERIDLCRFTKR